MGDPYSEFGGSQSTPAVPPSASDPYAEFGGTAEQAAQQPAAPSQPSAASRFWAGVKHGTGDNSDTPPSHGTWSHPDFADDPMLPGSGVYRDIKAGNYAGAAGRVVGPAAELALMVAAGGGRVKAPPERPLPAWQSNPVPSTEIPIETSTPAEIQAQLQRMANRAAQVPSPTRPAPAWQTNQPSPTELSVETSTPEEIQAQLSRMANRPKPTITPASAPAATPETSEGQSVPIGQLPIAKGNPYAGPRTPGSMQVAQSTNIGLHGYHPESQTMLVQFANGRVYEYRGVPQEVYDNFTNSESQGSFFAQQIKGRYTTNFRGTVKPSAGTQVKQALSR